MSDGRAHPLAALAGLTALVAGPEGAGKSALISALLSLAGGPAASAPAAPSPAASPPPERNPPALLAQILRSAPVRALRVRGGGALGVLRGTGARDALRLSTAATGGAPLVLLEASARAGAARISALLGGRRVDVVLVVLRLDDARAGPADARALEQTARAAGPHALARTLVVLTRGHARAPHALTFAQFVRGRRDAVWGALQRMVPPAVRGQAHAFADRSVRDPIVAAVPADIDAEPGLVWQHFFRFPWADRAAPHPPLPEGVPDADEVRALLAAVREADPHAPVDEALVDIDIAHDAHDDPVRNAMFEEVPPPRVAVVELSSACPVDAGGRRVLPDGTPWEPALVAAVAECAVRAPEGVLGAGEAAGEGAVGGAARLGLWGSVLQWVLADPRRTVFAEMILGGIVSQTIVVIHAMVQRAKERREPKDLVVRLTDEQFEKACKKFHTKDMFAMSLDGSGEAKIPEEAPLKEALEFGKLEDAEEVFFGAKQPDMDSGTGEK